MTLHFASIFPLFLALASISERVYAQQSTPLVEYLFEDNTDRTKNTGSGDDYYNLTLDGELFPAENNGITFDQNAARFTGTGCIEVPKSWYINYQTAQRRTISLDFSWDGNNPPNEDEPQILFEEGGLTNGINIVISPTDQSGMAELVMGMWEGDSNKNEVLERLFVRT